MAHFQRRHGSATGLASPAQVLLGLVALFIATLAMVLTTTTLAGGLFLTIRYQEIASSVVPAEALIQDQSRGGARILDRNGVLLYEFVDAFAGIQRPVPLSGISQHLIDATIATEDPSFYENRGLNLRGLARAGVENFAPFLLSEGGDEFFEGSGGSSITQQLAKNLYIPSDQRAERSVERKARETVIALELTQQYSKDQILEWYLNSISYGGIYTGVQAAAEGYFGKSASELSLAEASLLAGIPQSPALYNPFGADNLDAATLELSRLGPAKARQAEVLQLMAMRGYLTAAEEATTLAEPIRFRQARFDIEAPHFVLGRIADELTARFGPRALYDQGLIVTTTIDLELQHEAEAIVERYVTDFGEQANLFNGAMVAIAPRSGEILVYVGSRDYFRDDIEGRNDNAVAANSPGSTLKPFAFLTAFMKGWGTGTGIVAAPLEILDVASGEAFRPRDPIAQSLGPIPAAEALGNSLNTTAIKTIQFAGVPETIETLKTVGFTTFDDPSRYGPALITGGSEITLLDEVYAYSVLATGGVMRGSEAIATLGLDEDERKREPAAILEVTDHVGEVLYRYEPAGDRVVDEAYSYLVTSILSDGSNQCVTYGVCNALALANGYPSAAKTGTSEPFDDSRDIGETWTVGYTPELVSGIWAGNADNEPIRGISSTTVSLRAWKEFMVTAIEHLELPATGFERPAGVVEREVCWPSGRLPTSDCPVRNRYTSLFAAELLPESPDDLSDAEREIFYDSWWQLSRVTSRDDGSSSPARYVSNSLQLVLPEADIKHWAGAYAWAAANQVWLAGPRPTTTTDGSREPNAPPVELAAEVTSPRPNQRVSGTVIVSGHAAREFQLEWGRGSSPSSWTRISSGDSARSGALGRWSTAGLVDGRYSLRLVVDGGSEYQIPVEVANSAPGVGTAAPVAAITSPGNNSIVSGVVDVRGTAGGDGPTLLEVSYGLGLSPGAWSSLNTHLGRIVDGTLASWDTTSVPNGVYSVLVTVTDAEGRLTTSRVVLIVDN